MIEDARGVLTGLGVDSERVHVELFFVDEPPPAPRHRDRAPNGATSEVTIMLDGRSTTTAMARDRTILDSAQAERGDLPFACKGGVCGTCRAQVAAGEVDMVRNYALDPAEIDGGFVLTCQTYAVGDAVTVDYDA
ncbi:Putative phenylacetic acid degradation protein PaaE/phenylacetate-CoA oxygenase/reductase%2C PaaK subunit [Mycobacterium tuberculosis]|nr:Putative phenylacetic acid degradation protein PaaE/phenylacetate-CoA oxygenase/reductase%2C PaaK subunit [Mycobacterium tuberculosis]